MHVVCALKVLHLYLGLLFGFRLSLAIEIHLVVLLRLTLRAICSAMSMDMSYQIRILLAVLLIGGYSRLINEAAIEFYYRVCAPRYSFSLFVCCMRMFSVCLVLRCKMRFGKKSQWLRSVAVAGFKLGLLTIV